MQKHSSLSELKSEYDQGRLEKKILEGLIFKYLLENHERFHLFRGNRDKWIDFVTWFYPRLSRAVDLYKDTGSTFDNYISSIIQWACREYKAREAEHRTTEYVCWKAKAEEMEIWCPEPVYLDMDYEDEKARNKGLFPLACFNNRQILILFLKSYYLVTDDFLVKVADAIGIKKKILEDMVDGLHQMRSEREMKIRLFKENVYTQYYRCLAFQKRLTTSSPGTARYQKVKNYAERAGRRFSAMSQRFKQIRVDATNQQIADLLNIPKGTVDSTLHSIREKWKTLTDPLAVKEKDRYDEACSVTATASMQAMPQMS